MDIQAAHKTSIWHRSLILESKICGCFYCLATFEPSEIDEWTDFQTQDGKKTELGQTALCPKCGIDSVIGSASKFPITNEFLKEMHNNWFGT